MRVNRLGKVPGEQPKLGGQLPMLVPESLKSSLEHLDVGAGEVFWLTSYTTGLGTL